jgi:predicted MFS family arabinose efflux permease
VRKYTFGVNAGNLRKETALRNFFLTYMVSMYGTWAQLISLSWTAFTLSHSAQDVAAVVLARQGPAFVLPLLGGYLGDRYSLSRALNACQGTMLLLALAMSVALGSGAINASTVMLAGFALLYGCVSALEVPLRQAMPPVLLIDKSLLQSAMAFNAMLINCGRAAGPLAGAATLAQTSLHVCLAINALTLIPSVWWLSRLRRVGNTRTPLNEKHRSGFGYLALLRDRQRRAALARLLLFSITAGAYRVLLLPLSVKRLDGTPESYGSLLGACGIGMIAGAGILMAINGERLSGSGGIDLVRSIALCLFILPLLTSHSYIYTCVALIGMCVIMIFVMASVELQKAITEQDRAKTAALFVIASWGAAALGEYVFSVIVDRSGLLLCSWVIALLTALQCLTRLPVQNR